MIKIGFIGAVSEKWMGGLNYYKNLLYAISSLENPGIKIIVFVGKKTDPEIKKMFKRYAEVKEESIFDRKSLHWFFHKINYKLFKSNYFIQKILEKNHIQILSHSNFTNVGSCKTINWIPDFQHLHLPDMFKEEEIKYRNSNFMNLIKNSDAIILSSYDALKDFNQFSPKYSSKANVLQFVSQPDERYFNLDENYKKYLFQKYALQQEFFYLPNQFWKHKNHMLVFEAVRTLTNENIDICIVCTGYLKDYRNIEYIDNIRSFIDKNKLHKNIKLLGLVDYEDVFGLMKFSKAVINPSLFEGWSSTVEECKSVYKEMILSDLDVHKEQYSEAYFFDKYSSESLKELLKNYENNKDKKIQAKSDLKLRTRLFGEKYVNIVKSVIASPAANK